MSNFGSVSLGALRERGAISAADVLGLRKEVYGGTDNISKEQAADIIDLDRICTVQDPEWHDFYIETIADYIVEQAEPRGYITVQNATWLIGQLESEGQLQTVRGMELLAHILDKSRWSPAGLAQFALTQVKRTVLEGEGRMANGLELEKGVIGEAEVELIRRILFAFGGDGNIGISRAEAEVLFDLNEQSIEAENHPSWTDLFAKSIANYVMGASGYQVPSREVALRREKDDGDDRADKSSFAWKMVSGGLRAIWNSYNEQSREERELARLEQQKIQIITAEAITEEEAGWLVSRIQRDGDLCENEKALIKFIREESPNIHPSLKPLLAEAA